MARKATWSGRVWACATLASSAMAAASAVVNLNMNDPRSSGRDYPSRNAVRQGSRADLDVDATEVFALLVTSWEIEDAYRHPCPVDRRRFLASRLGSGSI